MCAQVNSPAKQPGYYQIILAGKIDASWAKWFGELSITCQKEADETCVTILSGTIVDQAALRGLLNRMWDLNLDLISVERVNPQDQQH